MARHSGNSIYMQDIPVEPDDDAITRIMKRIGLPEFVLPALNYNRMRRPVLYIWERGGKPLYIGVSENGMARPMSVGHHAIRRMSHGDKLHVWSMPNRFRAKILEEDLIAEFLPEFNRLGKPSQRRPRPQIWDRMDIAAKRERITEEISLLKESLRDAQLQLRRLSRPEPFKAREPAAKPAIASLDFISQAAGVAQFYPRR